MKLTLRFTKKYSNVAFLYPLIELMTAQDPTDRPDASHALVLWKYLRRRISFVKLMWRLRERHENWLQFVMLEDLSLVHCIWRAGLSLLSLLTSNE